MVQGVRKWATMKSSFMLLLLLPSVSMRRAMSWLSVVTGPERLILLALLPRDLPALFFPLEPAQCSRVTPCVSCCTSSPVSWLSCTASRASNSS